MNLVYDYGSYVLAGIGVFGLWKLSNKHRVGWYIGLLVQALWIAYGITTKQYGFIFSALAYGYVNFNGLRRSKNSVGHPIVTRDPKAAVSYVEMLPSKTVKNPSELQTVQLSDTIFADYIYATGQLYGIEIFDETTRSDDE